jgi:hypothetical protein
LSDHPPTPEQEGLPKSGCKIGFDLEDALRAVLVPHHSGNRSGYLSGNPARHHKQTSDTGGREIEVEGRELGDVYGDEHVVSRLFEFLKVESQHQDWNRNGRAVAWIDGQPNPVWGRRLLHDAGFLKPWPVGARRLPDTIADDAPERLVYEGFLLLVGLTWQVFPEKPVLFTRDFAVPWCGVSERQFRMAWAWLQEAEYVGLAGWVRVGRWDASLWLPRAGSTASSAAGARHMDGCSSGCSSDSGRTSSSKPSSTRARPTRSLRHRATPGGKN